MKENNRSKWVQVRITESEQKEIVVHSGKLGLSFSSFVRFLINDWINNHKSKK